MYLDSIPLVMTLQRYKTQIEADLKELYNIYDHRGL